MLASFSDSSSPPMVRWPLARLHSHHFSNLGGKTASIATISVNVLNLKVIGSDWTSLVHPTPITISKGYNALIGQAWVTSSLPANKRRTRQTERPRVHIHRFGSRGAFWVWKDLLHICTSWSSLALFYSFLPRWRFQCTHTVPSYYIPGPLSSPFLSHA